MSFQNIKQTVEIWLGSFSFLTDYLLFILILAAGYLAHIIVGRYLIRLAERLIRRTRSRLDDYLIESGTLKRLSYIVPILVIYNLTFIFPRAREIISVICNALIIWMVLISISAFLNAVNNYYETKPVSKIRPIKGYVQVGKIVIFIIGFIFLIGVFTGKSPLAILGGVGAMTAVLMLIFKDTILSFVSSIQISGYDLVHKGDWIEMPKYGADGDVIDIALHTIKVQNWDKTITVIPTSKLTEDSFKNWRGMTQSGGRRIKRSVYIDVNSIKFCDEDMIGRFGKIQLISEYVRNKQEELKRYNKENNIDESQPVNGRRMTNIGTYRAYIEAYIKSHKRINHGLTHMVRQLAPGSNGLPIEIYAFTNDTAWLNYEAIQADIFDHILAVTPLFDLRVYQNPSGQDISRINLAGQS